MLGEQQSIAGQPSGVMLTEQMLLGGANCSTSLVETWETGQSRAVTSTVECAHQIKPQEDVQIKEEDQYPVPQGMLSLPRYLLYGPDPSVKSQWDLEIRYYLWRQQRYPEAFMPPEAIDAAELLQQFPQEEQGSKRKCTNIAKFIFNVLLHLIEESEVGHRYQRWIASIKKRYCEKDKLKSRSRFSLMELLGDIFGDSQERLLWKQLHRQILCRELTQGKTRLILRNPSIPEFNKCHYLYYVKLYEWRLSDCRLLEHLK